MLLRAFLLFVSTLSSNFALGESTPKRIVSLAPHTTELAFAIGIGDRVVAVSDFSDYPEQAKSLPRIADHTGVNLEAIVRLAPDLILAWQGGNKPQDLARLQSLGFTLFYSNPTTPSDIPKDIRALGQITGVSDTANSLADSLEEELNAIKVWSASQSPKTVFYYMWPEPMMTIGEGAWANSLINHCHATNIFSDAAVDYPSVALEQVLKRKPQVIVAAMKTSVADVETYWASWKGAISPQFAVVNPDEVHRFTPRLIPALTSLCQAIHAAH